ncbi:MAG: protoheme IX farnesyltransferase [Sphingobacteriales bacterium]|nr:MAG: protoheme IX farnesyltransferase [Sphingobacteriales bacterium]
MIAEKLYNESAAAFSWKNKLRDYSQLIKFRLNMSVVFSTFLGFILGSKATFNWLDLAIVVFGGFLTVGAANGINQIIEKDSDRLMKRTENRPLATNRMGVWEATIACMIMGVAGVWMIGYYLNPLSAILSFVALCSYAFLYTPLKKVSPLSVYVGAIPGAISPTIGYVAATGKLDTFAVLLFVIQFIWQFPHFYSIAWILDDDYKRAGLKMMPLGTTKDRKAALQIVLFSVLLIPVSFLPYMLNVAHLLTCSILGIASTAFAYQSIALYRDLSNTAAKRLMFGSIIYLPAMFIILLLEKIL